MIEDNEVKIAENPEEALWEKVCAARENSIKGLEESLLIEKAFLELCKQKLQEIRKDLQK